MRADIRSAYKSEDTEEYFDKIFTKPLGYLWARFFMRLGWTPNMVTLLSMGIGFVGGLLFYPESFSINLIGVLLVIWANILDSTDGQMARLTGNKSTLGRILDALSTSVWYVAIYVALCLRLYDDPIPFSGGHTWGGWIWVVTIVSAFMGHQLQCMLADYYRNLHLFFLKNKHGSELERSRDVYEKSARLPWKGARFQKVYLYFYSLYTYLQEVYTPNTQRLLNAIEQSGGRVDDDTRNDYLNQSRKYIQLTNVLTFNARAYTLFLCVLLGIPLIYYPLELFFFGALLLYMRSKYEKIAEDVLYAHRLPGSETPPVKKKKYPAFFFAIGVVGIIVMLAKTDLSQVDWSGTVLRLLPVWLPAGLLVWLAIYVLHTFAYYLIMGPSRKNIRLMYLFKMTVSGFALNEVTPVGLAGGEPYRIMELKPYIGLEKATATTLTFTVMHIFSHVMFWFTGALMYLLLGCPGGILAMLVSILVLGVCSLALYAFFRSGKRGLVLPTLRLLSKLPLVGSYFSRLIEKSLESLEAIDRDMAAFHTRQQDFWSTVAIEYVGRLLEVLEFFIIFRVLGVTVSFGYCLMALACASLLGNLVFIIPMQVGSREAGMAMALSWIGFASSFSITASLLTRLREIFYLAAGVIAMLLKSRAAVNAEDQNAAEDTQTSNSSEAPENNASCAEPENTQASDPSEAPESDASSAEPENAADTVAPKDTVDSTILENSSSDTANKEEHE